MRKILDKIKEKATLALMGVKAVKENTKGEGYVDTGVKILIAVVLGALLLAGLYALFNTVIMPNVSDKVTDLFAYNG